ncbi:hypothetical protein OJF2_41450 [Aquisphaera giovannonii]|uniref:Uncharacterized protein n=1 Tax=Aquisphaera giovannonii TaxID=406548 RepID=A0A5B9W4U1_9BACT|nr:hypothetical protein [Aquisphaera giovannonii]QEH35592.1 hypothetical protein OJF2_41450 [Aquisphaera giovannonii]
MSLLVNAYVRDPRGEMSFIEPDEPAQELAGFEPYRRSLYGGRAAASLGLRLLPGLVEGDVYAEGEDLARLRFEAEKALLNIDLFEAESGAPAEQLRPRFQNILMAVGRAEQVGGEVVIW